MVWINGIKFKTTNSAQLSSHGPRLTQTHTYTHFLVHPPFTLYTIGLKALCIVIIAEIRSHRNLIVFLFAANVLFYAKTALYYIYLSLRRLYILILYCVYIPTLQSFMNISTHNVEHLRKYYLYMGARSVASINIIVKCLDEWYIFVCTLNTQYRPYRAFDN